MCITNFHQLRLWIKDSPYQYQTAKGFTIFICVLQAFIFGWSLLFLIRGQEFLYNQGIFPRISNLYEGIHLYKDKRNIFYTPVFMLRRLCFVLIPLIFREWQWCQLQLLIWLNFGYFAWYLHLQPHEERSRVQLEVFNECVILIVVYHMFAFSEMASDPKMMYAMGYSYITFVLILVCGNIAFLILKEIERQHRKRQLIMQQELWKQLLIQRKRGQIINEIHQKQEDLKHKLAEKDPDLLKPKLMKLSNLPQFYAKRVMLKHIGLATIREENIEDFDREINDEIFRDLGTFGDIFEKSRRQILDGFYCPDGKEPFQYEAAPIEIPELPLPMEPFEQTFAESSKQRWEAYELKYKKTKDPDPTEEPQAEKEKEVEKSKEKPKQKTKKRKSLMKGIRDIYGYITGNIDISDIDDSELPEQIEEEAIYGTAQAFQPGDLPIDLVIPSAMLPYDNNINENIEDLVEDLKSSNSSVIEVVNNYNEDFGRDTSEAFRKTGEGVKMVTNKSETLNSDEETVQKSKIGQQLRQEMPTITSEGQSKVISMLKTGMTTISKFGSKDVSKEQLRADSKETDKRSIKVPSRTVTDKVPSRQVTDKMPSQPNSAAINIKEPGMAIDIDDLEEEKKQVKETKKISVPAPTAAVFTQPKKMQSMPKFVGKNNKIKLDKPAMAPVPDFNPRLQALQQLEELGDQLNSDEESSEQDLGEVLQNYEQQSEEKSKYNKNKFNKK